MKITVVCCSPERVRDKLCYKGGSSIQKVDIVPDKPKEPAAKPKPKEPEKPKGEEKPEKSDPSPELEVAKMTFEPPVQGYPQMYPQSYHVVGYGYNGYSVPHGMPVAPHGPPQYCGFNGCNDYFSEENPEGCTLM